MEYHRSTNHDFDITCSRTMFMTWDKILGLGPFIHSTHTEDEEMLIGFPAGFR